MAKGNNPKPHQNAWSTQEQWDWLTSQKPEYFKARSLGKKALGDFWVSVFENWVATWPHEALTAEEVKKGATEDDRADLLKTRIKQWYNNNSRASSSGEGRRTLIDLKAKPRKKLPAYQAYQRLYESKIKAVVQEEWPDEWKSSKGYVEGKAAPPPSIKFQNEIALRLLGEESQDVKTKVEKYRVDRGEGDEIDDEDEDDGEPIVREEKKRVAKAKDFQRAIDALPNTMLTAMEQAGLQTGCIGTFIFAGPEPNHGGNIFAMSIHHGKTALGHDFGSVFGDAQWREVVEGPLIDFASKVYSKETCLSRALPGTEHLAIHYKQNGSSGGQPSLDSSRSSTPRPGQPAKNVVNQPRTLVHQIHGKKSTGAVGDDTSSHVERDVWSDGDITDRWAQSLEGDGDDEGLDEGEDSFIKEMRLEAVKWGQVVDDREMSEEISSGKAKDKGSEKAIATSNYEREKEANIARNKALLASLGLDEDVFQKKKKSAPRPRCDVQL